MAHRGERVHIVKRPDHLLVSGCFREPIEVNKTIGPVQVNHIGRVDDLEGGVETVSKEGNRRSEAR